MTDEPSTDADFIREIAERIGGGADYPSISRSEEERLTAIAARLERLGDEP